MTAVEMHTPPAKSKAELSYDWIRERIRARDFEPGYRLVLSQIADELDVSVVPVREAIRQLEAEGLVTYEHNVGARVSELNRRSYYELMESVAVLEAATTALSAPLLEDVALQRAHALNEDMRVLLTDFDPVGFTRLNQEFHQTLFSACPNQRLVSLVHREWEELDRYRVSTFRYVPERAEASVAEHNQLVSLIAANASPHVIEDIARNHRLKTKDAYKYSAHRLNSKEN